VMTLLWIMSCKSWFQICCGRFWRSPGQSVTIGFWELTWGVYYDPGKPAIVPDGFLSIGVERLRQSGKYSGKLRRSYIFWQENVVPQWVLETVSETPGGEYSKKMLKYAQIGILYYTVYNPDCWKRDKHDPLEVYRLVDGVYVRQPGDVVWMPELQLGIGRGLGEFDGLSLEWLYWYDEQGNQFPAPENVMRRERQRAEQERQRAEQAQQQLEALMAKLRDRGIDPDAL